MLSLNSNGSNHTSTISEGVRIEGKIHFLGPVKIEGEVMGNIISEDTLTIGRSGTVESNIKAKDIIISGEISGDIVASGLVEITSTGKLTGNITQESAMLKIEKGGIFNGKSIIQEKEVMSLGNFGENDSKVLKIAAAK